MGEESSGSNSGSYFHLKILGVARKHEDVLTQICFESGAAGVAEDLSFSQQDLRYEPSVLETPFLDMNVYFDHVPEEDALIRLSGLIQVDFPEAKLEMRAEENRDWMAEWKKGFKPFLFSDPFWVIPSWLTPPPEAPADPRLHLYVEPGMAFGTGTHETTRLAASYVVDEIGRARPSTVLDVGTGTGILALVAHRLGANRVVGIDNDPEARRTARENLEMNRAEVIEIPDLDLADVPGEFDLVIANIIDGVLLVLAQELTRHLKPGGRLILSGVLVERETEFYREFIGLTGLKLVKKKSEGEWSAAILEKA